MTEQIKIYVAGPWKHRDEAKQAKTQLEAAGYTVTSRWIDVHGDFDKNDPINDPHFAQQAVQDVQDLYDANAVVLLNLEKSEGKAAETGMAIAWEKPIVLVGERSNIFHYLNIPRVPSVEAAIALLDSWSKAYEAAVDAAVAEAEGSSGATN